MQKTQYRASSSSEKNIEPVAAAAQAQEAAPTLEDVLKLTKDSDFSAYVKPGIDPEVQKAAMQKLFSDPRLQHHGWLRYLH